MRRPFVALLLLAFLAGCSETPDTALVTDPTPTPAIVDEPVEWTGTMSGSCVQVSGGQFCSDGGLGGGDALPTYWHDAADRLLAGGSLTLEWDAATPSTETLRVVVVAYTGCPEECQPLRSITSETGPAPLSVPVTPLTLAPGETADDLYIAVTIEPVAFAPGMQVSMGQPLHLTGTLSFQEQA